MQNFEILLNNKYSTSAQTNTSGLDLINDYYVYITKNGGGIVNQSNVRGYLNDPKNEQITTDFFAYLTGSTSQDQALNILGSDKKLSDVFNDYYQRIILAGSQSSSTAVINQNLTGGSQVVGYTFNHPWNGYSPSKQLTGITQDINGSTNLTNSTIVWDDFTTEQSYFIPVYLERGTNQLARYAFDVCDVLINKKTAGFYPNFSGITGAFFGFTDSPIIQNNSSNNTLGDFQNETLGSTAIAFDNSSLELINLNPIEIGSDLAVADLITSSSLDLSSAIVISTADTKIHTLLSCFVDINLETNENIGVVKLPKVSFQFSQYDVNEGDNFLIRVDLNSPSVNGNEQITVDLSFPSTNSATLITTVAPNADFSTPTLQTYPFTLSWPAGQQYRFLSFSANLDSVAELDESFILKLINPINVDIGAVGTTVVNIKGLTPEEMAILVTSGRG